MTIQPLSSSLSLSLCCSNSRTRIFSFDSFVLVCWFFVSLVYSPQFCYIDPTSGELRLNDEITSLDAVEPEIAAEIHAAWPDYLQSLNALHRGLMQQRAKQYIDAANTALKGEGTASSSSTHAAPEKVASVVSFEANHPPWSLLDEPWTQANVTIQEYFRIKSLANRIGAGMGSLGSRRLFALCEGPTKDPWDDILLDIKAEGEPAWWRYTSSTTVRLVSVQYDPHWWQHSRYTSLHMILKDIFLLLNSISRIVSALPFSV